MKLSLVPVHTQIAAEQHSEDAPASDWDQHLRHLLPLRIPDEGAWQEALWVFGPEMKMKLIKNCI